MSAALLHRDPPRISSAIASRSEVANLVRVRPERLTSWAHPPTNGRAPPLVHTARSHGRFSIPLVGGIAEAASLNALRQGGMSMQQARSAAEYVRREYGDEYAMASPKLFTDGTDAFFEDNEGGLVRLRDRQGAWREVLNQHLRPLIIGPDGFVEASGSRSSHRSKSPSTRATTLVG